MLFPLSESGDHIMIAPRDLPTMFEGCAATGRDTLGHQLSYAYIDLLASMKLRANAFTEEQFEDVEKAIGRKHIIKFPFTSGVVEELSQVYETGLSIEGSVEDPADDERMAAIEFLNLPDTEYQNMQQSIGSVSLEEAIARHPATVTKNIPSDPKPSLN